MPVFLISDCARGAYMNKTFDDKVKEARLRVSQMDDFDGVADRLPKTILLALESGLKNPATDAHYDAYVMLQDVVKGDCNRKDKA